MKVLKKLGVMGLVLGLTLGEEKWKSKANVERRPRKG